MSYRIDMGAWNGVFAVPHKVVDDCLKLSGSANLKVLLYLLRHAGEDVDSAQIAQAAGVSREAVADALLFWAEMGVLAHEDGAAAPAKSKTAKHSAPPPAPPAPEPIDQPPAPAAPVETVDRNVRILSKEPPRPTPTQILERRKRDREVDFLLRETEQRLGRPMKMQDNAAIVSLVDWAGLPSDVILMIVEYCTTRGKNAARDIERTALRFIDNGIDDHDKAESYIKRLISNDKLATKVRRAFGLSDRTLSTREQAYIERWSGELGYGIELITLAYERCVDNTGKLSFPYIDKVLSSWHDKGIKTRRDAEQESSQPPKKSANGKGSKEPPSFDIAQTEAQVLSKVPQYKKRSE